ncbi:MAG: hypothetical protein IPP15_06680 [Saprospiraceae bacterium]|uniref:Transposase IS200-like domain-containing protein n=1 Tax=Candidatus Opimibacter skivensis TaxID=2982028 RepID=A0A9D7SWC5_9BACT|nr:hypothetical protein [Candidatus Opimibacter skivensis]
MKPVRKRVRLKGYDYSRDGLYYFTSNVKNDVCFLGEIRNKKAYLNDFGKIVLEQWYWLEENYPYVVLHQFVVMPNHIHGILEISRENILNSTTFLSDTSTIKIKPFYDLIGAFKMTASKLIRIREKETNADNSYVPKFSWHRSFHDHIIRSNKAYLRISNYIVRNPENWKNDEYFPKSF